MKTLKFTSKLGPSIEFFIAQKRLAGHPYDTSADVLWHFDQMIAADFPDCDELTRDICDAWIAKNSKAHPQTLHTKVSPVRQYAKFQIELGKSAYVIPSNVPGKIERYEDHIFTDNELKAFFAAVDSCRQRSPNCPVKHYVAPVIFRLLYTCGLRNSEARRLTIHDVDLETGKIKIAQSKGWAARIVYVSADMLDLMRRYNTLIHKVFPDRIFFFPNNTNTFMSRVILEKWFRGFWYPLPEAKVAKGNRPRVHSFRHAFCRDRINDWLRKGLDIKAMSVYLSEFVGHTTFVSTDYYLKLAASIYPELNKRMHDSNVAVLPEVPEDEED